MMQVRFPQELFLNARDVACLRGDHLLFKGVNLHLSAGDCVHIQGANGIGKSSLMRILAGLALPYAGGVEHNGASALVDERPALDASLPLGKALAFWRRLDGDLIGHPFPSEAWDTCLARLGLEDLLDVPVRFLSTGQRKRAALARLIGQSAPIWFLDEPLNGLDVDAVALVQELVEEHCLRGGISVIASHQAFFVAHMTRLNLTDYTT